MDRPLVITGSYPPDVCGVGDYARNVMSAPTAAEWGIYYRPDWRPASLLSIIREIRARRPREIFMQYPTQGYGWSLVPHLVCLYFSTFTHVRFTVVLHEFSQLSAKARLAARLLLLSADQILFTNEFERAAAAKAWGPVGRRSRTVKIVSNIPVADATSADASGPAFDLAYFGHVRPKKGIEAFVKAVREIRRTRPALRIALIGQCPPGFEAYAEALLAQCRALGVTLLLELDDLAVAGTLTRTRVVYLPFPDGISERRGTALAAMANGALLLTTAGHHTPPELAQVVAIVDLEAAPATVAARLEELLRLPDDERVRRIERARIYLSQQLPRSWDDVARAYLRQA
jgi:glycosyltransferase involved in cell wall biosynthesis